MDEPKHILVVDDEADLVELVSYNLKKEGFIVDSASNGEAARISDYTAFVNPQKKLTEEYITGRFG